PPAREERVSRGDLDQLTARVDFLELAFERLIERLEPCPGADDEQAAAIEITRQAGRLGIGEGEVVVPGHEQEREVTGRLVIQSDRVRCEIDVDLRVFLETAESRILDCWIEVPAAGILHRRKPDDIARLRAARVDGEFLGKETPIL